MKSKDKDPIGRTELNLLRQLQSDGRLTNAELASRINVSPATCHRRTQQLYEDGYITGVRAMVDPQKVGLGALVMVGIVLDRSTPESFAAFEEAIKDEASILDCDLVAGDFDYLLRIRVRDMGDFNQFHTTKLISLPGVRQARTFFVIKEVKSNAPLQF